MNTRQRRDDRERVTYTLALVAQILRTRHARPHRLCDLPGWTEALAVVVRDDRRRHYTLTVLVLVGESDILRRGDRVTPAAVRDLAKIAAGRVPRPSPQVRKRFATTWPGGWRSFARGTSRGTAPTTVTSEAEDRAGGLCDEIERVCAPNGSEP